MVTLLFDLYTKFFNIGGLERKLVGVGKMGRTWLPFEDAKICGGKEQEGSCLRRNVNGGRGIDNCLELSAVQGAKEGRRVCVWKTGFLQLLDFCHFLHSRNEHHQFLI